MSAPVVLVALNRAALRIQLVELLETNHRYVLRQLTWRAFVPSNVYVAGTAD